MSALFNLSVIQVVLKDKSNKQPYRLLLRCSQNPLWREHFENQAKHSYIVFAIV